MLEIEKTYLAKFIPEDLKKFSSKEIIDVYFPVGREHPNLRLRKNGEKYNLTKKQPVDEKDAGSQEEQTIILDEEEFQELQNLNGKYLRKIRYQYEHNGQIAEFDIFQDDLSGLILIDFEFNTEKERDNFIVPDFCLVEVTQEELIAGGMLAGKKYEDIENILQEKYNYKKIY